MSADTQRATNSATPASRKKAPLQRADPMVALCKVAFLRRKLGCPVEPADAAWDAGQSKLACNALYSGALNYRLGDVTGSRWFRHSSGGLHYHRRNFPNSLADKYLRDYRHGSAAYDRYYNASCSQSCGRSGRCQCYVPRVDALYEILSHERTQSSNRTRDEAYARGLSRTAAVHLRVGDVVEESPHTIDQMLGQQTMFKKPCNSQTDPEGCVGISPVVYVQPLQNYAVVVRRLHELRVQRIAIVAAAHVQPSTTPQKSCAYVRRIGTYFRDAGFEVTFRLGRHPDDDFRFFTRVACMVPSLSGFAQLAGDVAQRFGVQLLRPAAPAPVRAPVAGPVYL